MNPHLSDEQMTECLLETAPPGLAQHIASCTECSSELRDLRSGLSAYAAAVRDDASQAVLPRLSFVPTRVAIAGHSFACAAALVLFALATLLLRFSPSPGSKAAPLADSQRAAYANTTIYDNDDALLLSIQRGLESDVPQALAPAALLTAERNRVILNMREEPRNQ